MGWNPIKQMTREQTTWNKFRENERFWWIKATNLIEYLKFKSMFESN